MRPLKTKYPCVKCGEPAEVASRREIERAKCPRCRERDRLIYVSAGKDTRANGCAPIAPGEPGLDGLVRWLEAVESRVGAALAIAKAVKVARQGERRLLVGAARERLQWAARVARKLDEGVFPAVLVETPGFEAISGGADDTTPTPPTPAPLLRLVGRGDAP